MSRPTPPSVGAGLIAVGTNIGLGIPIYLWAGLTSYFMNDLPGADDNLGYLRWGVIAALLSAGTLVLLSVRNPGVSWRAVAFATGASAAVNGAWLAFFFGSQISDLGDDSGTMYDPMPTSTVRTIAVSCAVVALIGLAMAVRSRQTTAIPPKQPVDPRP